MTLAELAEYISERQGTEYEIVWGVLDDAVDEIVRALQQGREVKIRKLGTFRWEPTKAKTVSQSWRNKTLRVPGGEKLRFRPARALRSRRVDMNDHEDDGMTKVGVVLDDEKIKQAGEGDKEPCRRCGKLLDDARICEDCGTEPLEKRDG